MNPFDNASPFAEGGLIFNRTMTLIRAEEDRDGGSASFVERTTLATFLACEPQLVQRLTENLVFLEDMATMQRAPYRISTETKDFPLITKGLYIKDAATNFTYRIIAYYRHEWGYDFTVTELDD